jgi:hypothetical protein
MRTDNNTSIDNILAVNTAVLMKMLNCGKPTAIKIGTEAGAKIVIGRKILWNPRIIRRYLDDISE